MERPVDAKIVIRREDDMLVVSVPEVLASGTRFARPTLGSLLLFLAGPLCVGIFNFYHMDFGVALAIFTFILLPVSILITRDFFRKAKEPPPFQKATAVVFREGYFVATDTEPDEGKYLYFPEFAPVWEDVGPFHDVPFAVSIPCRYPAESPENHEECGSYEIACRSAEEARWILHEIEKFFESVALK